MSRRQSLFKKENPGKPRVRFPDELVFQDSVKENDVEQINHMLRRASLKVDINSINSAGLTALHQAVLDGNFTAVRLLLNHGAEVNTLDEDGWTPLHAACIEGHSNIAGYLIRRGADLTVLNPDGSRPIDLCSPSDMPTISIMIKAGQRATKSRESSDDPDSHGLSTSEVAGVSGESAGGAVSAADHTPHTENSTDT